MQKNGAIILAIVIGLLVVGGIIAVVQMNNQDFDWSTGTGPNGQGLGFEDNDEESSAVFKSITMPGWNSITIAAGTTDVKVNLYNPERNAGKYHMTFELKLADGETLYKSAMVKAGDHLRYIQLNRPLEPGTYDAILHIQPYTADSALTALNNANVRLKLIAE